MRDKDRVLHAMQVLRDAWPDMERLFTEGQCYTLARAIQVLIPGTEILYSRSEGHVYFRVEGCVIDIRGKHIAPPCDLALLDHRDGDPPHRWARRDRRRLV